METRWEGGTVEEMEVGTLETGKTGADPVLGTTCDVLEGYGIRHGNLKD